MKVYQRDNSWYRYHGRGGKYHFMGKDLASSCGRARMLLVDEPREASQVPKILRCKSNGCTGKWPDNSH